MFKKSLIITIFLVVLSANAQTIKGQVNVSVPKWSSYCPTNYVNANPYSFEEITKISEETGKQNSQIFWCKSDTKLANTIRWATIIPALDCKSATWLNTNIKKSALLKDNLYRQYWAKRKIEFDNYIQKCAKLPLNQRNACYNGVNGKIGMLIMRPEDLKLTILINSFPNSPFSKLNIPLGAQLLQVDGMDVTKIPFDQVLMMIQGVNGTTVRILMQSPYSPYEKKEYSIKRELLKQAPKQDDFFFAHWKQIVPPAFIHAVYIEPTFFYYSSTKQEVLYNNYWAKRKIQFKQGYDACKMYPVSDRNTCYMNLVNREISKTDNDKQLELQQSMMYQQALYGTLNNLNQIQMNNTLNSIDSSLRMQNYNIQNTNMQLYNINNTIRKW